MKQIRKWYNRQDEQEKSAIPFGLACLAIVPIFAILLMLIKKLL